MEKIALLGRPRLGDVTKIQIRIKESKEFKVSSAVQVGSPSKWAVGEVVQYSFGNLCATCRSQNKLVLASICLASRLSRPICERFKMPFWSFLLRSCCFFFLVQSSVDRMMQRSNASMMMGASSWRDQFLEAFTVQAGESRSEIRNTSNVELHNTPLSIKCTT